MKRNKRIIAIILAVLSVALMCTPLLSFAQVREGEAHLLQEGDFIIEECELPQYNANKSAYATVCESAYNGLMDMQDYIDVSAMECTTDEISDFYGEVINDHPDLFFVSKAFSIYINRITQKVTGIVPEYTMSREERDAAMLVFQEGVARALRDVNDSMSDLQKVLTVHDYICSYAIYPDIYDADGNYVPEQDRDLNHTAYGFFLDNTAVCEGYTLSFIYLMHQLGIECEYAASDAMEHAWNMVKIDGKWYNIDITYDNQDYVTAENTYGAVFHDFFMKSDSYFQSESGFFHYDYYTYDECTADDLTYDDYFWDDVCSRIYTLDGNYYYLKPNLNTQITVLTKRTLSGTETSLTSAFPSSKITSTFKPKDSYGIKHVIEKCDYSCRLCYLDGKFYINDTNKIYAVTPEGSKTTITSGINYPVSLGCVEGNLVYQTYNEISTVVTLDKKQYFRDNLGGSNVYPDCNNDGVVNGRDWGYIINP